MKLLRSTLLSCWASATGRESWTMVQMQVSIHHHCEKNRLDEIKLRSFCYIVHTCSFSCGVQVIVKWSSESRFMSNSVLNGIFEKELMSARMLAHAV